MSDDLKSVSIDLIPLVKREISGEDLGVVSRGLEDSEQMNVTPQQIANARANNRAFESLSNLAIKIALEQRANWQYRMFFQVISDEVRAAEKAYRKLMLRDVTTETGIVDGVQMHHLFNTKLEEFKAIIKRYIKLGNDIIDACETYKSPDDVDMVLLVARLYGEIYRDLLDWSLEILSWQVHRTLKAFQFRLSDLALPMITEMANFGSNTLNEIEDKYLSTSATIDIEMLAPMKTASPDRLIAELLQAIQDWVEAVRN